MASSYQWNLNGTPIPGATDLVYMVSSAAAGDAGNYTVTVTNPAGSAVSSTAIVVVGTSITSNPQNISLFVTQTATFYVSAQGKSPFTYQWYEIPSGSAVASAISGATNISYTTPATTLADNGNQYYVVVTDSCGLAPLTSASATLTVSAGNVPPTILAEPVGQTVATGGTTSFSVTASGTPALMYQWYEIPAGMTAGTAIPGALTSTYVVPPSSTAASDDQDQYYVIVKNSYGQAVSQNATLAVGNGTLILITNQPTDQYVNTGDPATFSVTATSSLPLTYQWYRAEPGTAVFNAIPGGTSATYTLNPTSLSDTGATYRVVASNGSTTAVTSATGSLFVGPLASVNNFCDATWRTVGSAIALGGCSFQLTASAGNQHGEVVWPALIATGNVQLSFTVTISNPSAVPADGFAIVFGDPALGATPASTGAVGQGLGARGIPGLVFGFDTYHNAGDPTVPYAGVGRGEAALWENPWFNVNQNIPALAMVGGSITHSYVLTMIDGIMTVALDGNQVFSGPVQAPPVAYLYITASTGGSFEKTVVSNLSATVSTP